MKKSLRFLELLIPSEEDVIEFSQELVSSTITVIGVILVLIVINNIIL